MKVACVAGVQRGGRGELNASAKRDHETPTIALHARIQLLPSLPFVRRSRRLVWKQYRRGVKSLVPLDLNTFLHLRVSLALMFTVKRVIGGP